MLAQKIQLRETRTLQLLEAELHDQLTLSDLVDAEQQWSDARYNIIRQLHRLGAAAKERPQSLHWDWARKSFELSDADLSSTGKIRLSGVRLNDRWQGMVYLIVRGRKSRLHKPAKPLVYIDYIETAPWNWDIHSLKITGQFRGVGIHLIMHAISWSVHLGYQGRLGLHSLPQARDFYAQRLGMTDLGPDASYDNLRYFELSEAAAKSLMGKTT